MNVALVDRTLTIKFCAWLLFYFWLFVLFDALALITHVGTPYTVQVNPVKLSCVKFFVAVVVSWFFYAIPK